MCYNYDRENVREGINMLNYRKIEPADNKALAELIRSNLEYYHLDIAGTVYFDPELDHMSDFYNAISEKAFYNFRHTAPDWYEDRLFDDDKQIAQDNINTLKSIYDNNNLGVIYC